MTKIAARETIDLENKIAELTEEIERLNCELSVSDDMLEETDQIIKLRVDTALVMRRVLFLTQNPSIEASIENTIKLKRFIEENWEPIEFCGREYAP